MQTKGNDKGGSATWFKATKLAKYNRRRIKMIKEANSDTKWNITFRKKTQVCRAVKQVQPAGFCNSFCSNTICFLVLKSFLLFHSFVLFMWI